MDLGLRVWYLGTSVWCVVCRVWGFRVERTPCTGPARASELTATELAESAELTETAELTGTAGLFAAGFAVAAAGEES